MPEPVEVAILTALLSRAQAFADAQGLTISMPNVAFDMPPAKTVVGNVTTFGKWLKADFISATAQELGVSFSAGYQYGGIFQISVFYGIGAGEPAPARIAAAARRYFERGTECWQDGYCIRFLRRPEREPMMVDGAWNMIPVTIPYVCFAPA